MYTSYNNQLGKDVHYIHPGEYYATFEDEVIGTLLGSCISIALYDPGTGCGGLNHFMLPSSISKEFYLTKSGKYGMYAMELLINALFKIGCEKSALKAKVFGGASVLRQYIPGINNVSHNNIDFAFNYLDTEEIPVVSSDVGGIQARKIFFYPSSGKVLLKRIAISSMKNIAEEEMEYYTEIKQEYER